MDTYQIIKTIHIISAAILFGTGIGIAFFMFASHYAKNMHEKYFAARMTVLADYIFTVPAVILQPLTGYWLIVNGGYGAMDLWLKWTYALYILTGLCWLPVVWIQLQLRQMLATATANNTDLPARYHRLFRLWFCLGWPAFLSLVVIFYLMVTKPV
ncbi:MAG: DUF2269 domain-containing protein [Alphaproteobacteria bacterium]|nr:DUF2269 domain-containing protein [Alphaproteobacteria bacterium]